MGRQIRMVPADWQHPTNEAGHLIPLLEGYADRLADWKQCAVKFKQGLRQSYVPTGLPPPKWVPLEKKYHGMTYEEYAGECPRATDYMPDWPASERTHWCMYEDTTEGTPISPVFATAEELARWLADNGASAFGDHTATYEQWLATCKRGESVGLVVVTGTVNSIKSGVA